MISTILANYGLELLFGLVSAGALAFCKHLWKKNKELENIVCELKKQLKQAENGLKNTQTQRKNKSDNPFERMSIW